MKQVISCQLNGKATELLVDTRQSLLEALRGHGLTGTKEGCCVGECGACTVLIDDVPINACIALAVRAEGTSIRTIEGEAVNGQLSAVQEAYVDAGAVQCGFCTPGLVMKTTAFVEDLNRDDSIDRDSLTREDIRREHAGNLCRCTGYQTIVDAAVNAVNAVKS
ncbi:xanthine dehydrogenase [Endozoicomonas montiporae]|uniref:Xanthine dehydrogenase n=2 Tax=Endozoicomonas montiporae TaxID=1027273 RepID=A0A081N4S5_9GAMM|nr:2Fe-2S iron-sulfur cluster-binding protein [Endozoicomonas montiporae]AMO57683.1 xanthine dehydrogenase iron-sulfur-binding subunit [Endozoicomonas montiporae CL-33]KEQ13448.1 xanthine dehydrogenase [Endozoicomonas montiporae]